MAQSRLSRNGSDSSLNQPLLPIASVVHSSTDPAPTVLPSSSSTAATHHDSPFDDLSFENEYEKKINIVSSKGDVQQAEPNKEEAVIDPKSGKHVRCKCFCGGCVLTRRAYYTLVTSLCCGATLLFIIIGLYAIIPAILHSQINKSSLDFDTISIVGIPTNDSMNLHSQGSIGNLLHVSAKMDDAILGLYQSTSSLGQLGDDSDKILLGTMLFPGMTLDGSADFDVNATFQIDSVVAFQAWMGTILTQNQVTWTVESTISVTPLLFGSLELITYSGLTYKKDVTAPGCGGLTDVKLVSFNMMNSTADHLYVTALISLTNPSVFAINPLGTLHFEFFYEGIKQGDMYSVNNQTVMNVGVNLVEFSGELIPTPGYWNVTHDLVVRYLTGHDSELEARPSPQDGSSIPLYNSALAGLVLPTTLPGVNGSLISNVGVLSALMIPDEVQPTIQFDMETFFTIDSPLGLNAVMNAETIQLNVTVYHLNKTVDADGNQQLVPIPIGQLVMPQPQPVSPFNVSLTNHTHTFRASMVADLILCEPFTNYQSFVSAFVAEPDMIGFRFIGVSNVTASYLYGELDIIGLPVNVDLYMQGGGGLNHTVEKQLQVLGNRDGCGQQYCGVLLEFDATIVNPSLLTLNLSNSWFDLYYETTRLGSLEVIPLYMEPGNNEIKAVGFLNPAQMDLPVMSTFLSQFVAGMNHSMHLQGLNYDPSIPTTARVVNPNSAHSWTLSGLDVAATCFGIKVQLLDNFQIQQFSLDFSSMIPPTSTQSKSDDPPIIVTSAIVTADVHLPSFLALPLTIIQSDLDLNLLQSDGSVIGELVSRPFPITYEPGSNSSLILKFDNANFFITDITGFESFAANMISSTQLNVSLDGYANPTTLTNMGELDLTRIHQVATVPLIGYDSFYANPEHTASLLTVISLDLVSATRGPPGVNGSYAGGGSIQLKCKVSLTNPSQVILLNLGLFKLDLYYEDVRLATVELANFSVGLGENVYDETCGGIFWNPIIENNDWTPELKARTFLSAYLNGGTSAVSLLGKILQPDGSYLPGTEISVLQPAFMNFSTALSVPGSQVAFVEKLYVYFTLWDIILLLNHTDHLIIPARAILYNPFSVSVTVTALSATVLAGNLTAPVGGYLLPQPYFEPIYLPPHSRQWSIALPVWLNMSIPVAEAVYHIFCSPNHTTGISLVGNLTAYIGATAPGQPDPQTIFNQTMDLAANAIPTAIGNITSLEDFRPLLHGSGLCPNTTVISKEARQELVAKYLERFPPEHIPPHVPPSTPHIDEDDEEDED